MHTARWWNCTDLSGESESTTREAIAVFGDIHDSVAALEAVFEDTEERRLPDER